MATITQTIQWYVHQQAIRIHSIKAAAITRQAGEKYVYVSADRKRVQDRRPTQQEMADGWKLEKVNYEKITGHMSPRHSDWLKYQTARNQASLLLTARLLLKIGCGCVPELAEVRAVIKEGKLSHHAKKGRARHLAYKAYRYLRKVMNRLERAPERFHQVDQWQKSLQSAALRDGQEEEAHA